MIDKSMQDEAAIGLFGVLSCYDYYYRSFSLVLNSVSYFEKRYV